MKLFITALVLATFAAGVADASEHKNYTEAQCTASAGHHWRAATSYTRKKDGRVINVRAHCRKPSAAAAEKQYQAYLARSPEGVSADGKVSD